MPKPGQPLPNQSLTNQFWLQPSYNTKKQVQLTSNTGKQDQKTMKAWFMVVVCYLARKTNWAYSIKLLTYLTGLACHANENTVWARDTRNSAGQRPVASNIGSVVPAGDGCCTCWWPCSAVIIVIITTAMWWQARTTIALDWTRRRRPRWRAWRWPTSIHLDVCLSLSFSLCVYVCVCVSIYLSFHLSVLLSIHLSVCYASSLSTCVWPPVCISVWLFVYLCVCVCLSTFSSVCLSIRMCICLSACLSICLCVHSHCTMIIILTNHWKKTPAFCYISLQTEKKFWWKSNSETFQVTKLISVLTRCNLVKQDNTTVTDDKQPAGHVLLLIRLWYHSSPHVHDQSDKLWQCTAHERKNYAWQAAEGPEHDWLIEEGLTSHQTHYRSYGGRVFTSQMTQSTVSKHWRKGSWTPLTSHHWYTGVWLGSDAHRPRWTALVECSTTRHFQAVWTLRVSDRRSWQLPTPLCKPTTSIPSSLQHDKLRPTCAFIRRT